MPLDVVLAFLLADGLVPTDRADSEVDVLAAPRILLDPERHAHHLAVSIDGFAGLRGPRITRWFESDSEARIRASRLRDSRRVETPLRELLHEVRTVEEMDGPWRI